MRFIIKLHKIKKTKNLNWAFGVFKVFFTKNRFLKPNSTALHVTHSAHVNTSMHHLLNLGLSM